MVSLNEPLPEATAICSEIQAMVYGRRDRSRDLARWNIISLAPTTEGSRWSLLGTGLPWLALEMPCTGTIEQDFEFQRLILR